jgi:hypothetical protein
MRSTLDRLGGRILAGDDGPDAMQSFHVCAEFGAAARP